MNAVTKLAEAICVCTSNHDPDRRIECSYALAAAEKVVAAGWRPHADAGHRYDLLRAVLSYVDTHPDADLPLTLLEAIRTCVLPPGSGDAS